MNNSVFGSPLANISLGESSTTDNIIATPIQIELGGNITNSRPNTIILNASGTPITTTQPSTLHIKPIRNDVVNSHILSYNNTSGEIIKSTIAQTRSGLYPLLNIEDDTVAIGFDAGFSNQALNAIAIGFESGKTSQGLASVAIGYNAGLLNQQNQACAIGANAGAVGQGAFSVAIGRDAGFQNQKITAVAIGLSTGKIEQGINAIAIGTAAGENNQGQNAIAMGYDTGYSGQGSNSIAIGQKAGFSNQAANSIILNATGIVLNNIIPQSTVIKPIRADNINTHILSYNDASGEIFKTNVGQVKGTLYPNLKIEANDKINIGRLITDPFVNTVVLNASGTLLTTTRSGFYVNPINNFTVNDNSHFLVYNDPTKEAGKQSINNVKARLFPTLKLNGNTVAMGVDAGGLGLAISQEGGAVAIGERAGNNLQGAASIAIGQLAGEKSQEALSIAIGLDSGNDSQGYSSIAIGAFSGNFSQPANSIIINASGEPLNSTEVASLTIKPIRLDTAVDGTVLSYNDTTGEVQKNNTIISTLINRIVALEALSHPQITFVSRRNNIQENFFGGAISLKALKFNNLRNTIGNIPVLYNTTTGGFLVTSTCLMTISYQLNFTNITNGIQIGSEISDNTGEVITLGSVFVDTPTTDTINLTETVTVRMIEGRTFSVVGRVSGGLAQNLVAALEPFAASIQIIFHIQEPAVIA